MSEVMSEDEIIDNTEKLTYEVLVEDNCYNWEDMSPKEIATIMKGLLDLYQKEKEKNSKAIAHIEACKTSLGNYILSPNETEYLLKILGKENNGKQM